MSNAPDRRLLLLGPLPLVLALVVAAIWGSSGALVEPATAVEERPPEVEPIPKIDVHVHVGLAHAAEAIEIMDENGIAVALNASGGSPGAGLERSIQLAEASEGRLRPYCNLSFRLAEDPQWGEAAAEALGECKRLGAVGWKIFKSLGLGVPLADGSLLAVDDPRLDPAFEAAGELGLPVLIHSGDPQAFFRPATPDNERYDELSAHPSWSFHGDRLEGGSWPSWEEVFAQYERRVARHPGTTFVGAHFGNVPEEPRRVARMLEEHANLVVETGARIPEIGRHPAGEMRRFFERFQDRVLFGTDLAVTGSGLTLGSRGEDPDRREQVPEFFAAHYRYFETEGRDMAHPTPIQGRWTIDGVGLPRPILEKIYWRNAARIFGLSPPGGAPQTSEEPPETPEEPP